MKLFIHLGFTKITGKPKAPHYWFTLVASNGRTVMTSETYTRRRNAAKSMHSIAARMMNLKCYDENLKPFNP